MEPDSRERGRRGLMTALTVLSLPADEQVRVTEPGCVPCDISIEFEIHVDVFRQHRACTAAEAAALDAVAREVAAAVAEPYECFDHAVLLRPAWERVRARAAEALRVLGWTGLRVHPYTETAPGVLHRAMVDPGERG